jgi:EpsD family peptidyl-prolyl cis-trans isomerase
MSNRQSLHVLHRLSLVASSLVMASLLTACLGDDKAKPAGATQAAARVNDSEVTVHQINMVLERQPGLTAEQTDKAAAQVLEGLIDQELAVQKAEESKLDRDPKVVQLLDSTRKAVLARQYYEKTSSAAVAPPSQTDIQKYFDENPGLFTNRRTYMLQEFSIQADPAQTADIQAKLEATANAKDFVETLKASGLKASVNQVTQPAESLPLALVSRISQLQDGKAIFEAANGGLRAVLIVASRPEPLTLDQAKPLIERFLTETKRSEWLKNHVKELRQAAAIEYMGKFTAKGAAASAPAASAASGAQ